VLTNSFLGNDTDPGTATLRLLVVPHAGGGAAAGAGLLRHAPADWLVATARLPGRESRYLEPVTGFAGLVDDVVATARGLGGNAPLVIAGVCTGAVIALDAVRRLQSADPTAVAGFVAVSHRAPDESPTAGTKRLSDTEDTDELLAILVQQGGIPAAIAGNADLVALYLPTVLADARAVETHRGAPDPPLTCPLLTITGYDDALVPAAGVTRWSRYAPEHRHARIPGGHALLQEQPGALLDAIAGNADMFGQPGLQLATGGPA
jgi:surfactin synthase thioesterase subunit